MLSPLDRLWRAARRRGRRTHALLWAADGVHDLADGRHHARFEDWCAAHNGRACHVRVSDGLLIDLLPEPGTPLQAGRARLQWAQRVVAHYHGPESATWPLVAWPAAGGGAPGVSAWRGADLAALQDSVRRHGVMLDAVAPLWPALLQRLLKVRPALATAPDSIALWIEGGCAGIATLQRGRLVGLQRRRLPVAHAAGADPANPVAGHATPAGIDDAVAILQRLVDETRQGEGWPVAMLWVGTGAPTVGQAAGLDLAGVLALSELAALRAGPALQWQARQVSPQIDFMRPLPRPGALAWMACAASLALLATAAIESRAAFNLRAAAQALAPPGAKPQPPAGGTRVAPGRQAESAVWVAQAAHPWAQVMQASERASLPGVTWQSLEHEAGGELRLRGRSAQPGQARAVAAALRRQGPWSEVWVVRQEAPDEGNPKGGEQFEIVARSAGQRP